MARHGLGRFEQLVLLACLQLGEQAYPVSVMREIEARTGREPAHAAVFMAIKRLEHRGLVTTYLGESTPERGGRPKRRVKVETAAVRQLVEARDEFLSMWRGLESLGDGVSG